MTGQVRLGHHTYIRWSWPSPCRKVRAAPFKDEINCILKGLTQCTQEEISVN